MAKTESGSKAAKLLKFTLVLLLVIAASVGATLFIYSQTGIGAAIANAGNNQSQPEPVVVLPPPIFLPLEPFTVTLRHEQRTRILHLAITLRLNDENSRKLIVEYMPEVRDRVLRTLTAQNPEQVQTAQGRESLVAQLTQTLETPYHPQPKGPAISSVLFTAFVVQ